MWVCLEAYILMYICTHGWGNLGCTAKRSPLHLEINRDFSRSRSEQLRQIRANLFKMNICDVAFTEIRDRSSYQDLANENHVVFYPKLPWVPKDSS